MHLSKAKWKRKKKINVAHTYDADMEYSVTEYFLDTDSLKFVADNGISYVVPRKEFMENYYELV